jgi:hypothetical protein
MKTAADHNLTRSLPPLLITAVISAASVIILAVLFAPLIGGSSRPSPSSSARVEPESPLQPPPERRAAIQPVVANKTPTSPPVGETPATQPPVTHNLPVAAPAATPAGTQSLADARAEYERERMEFRQAVAEDLALRETAARESASTDALERATAATAAFAQGIIPNEVPEPALAELLTAREQLAAALRRASETARGNRDESQAAALDQELAEFQAKESADVGNVIHRFPKCDFRLINLETGLALAAKSTGRGSAVIQAKEDPASLLQHWYVTYPTKPYSRVKNRGSKMVLNVPAGNRAGGVKIILWQDQSSEFNFWEVRYRGSYYDVRSRFSKKLLSVPAAKKDEGLQLIQWPQHDAPDDQKWKLIRVPATEEAD